MVNHAYRTGYRTVLLLNEHVGLTAEDVETSWVAALLHDVGLDVPPQIGDFSLGGVETLERLAREVSWPMERVFEAAQAIASNLSSHVDRNRFGLLSWAMNLGGAGEVTYGPHRRVLDRTRARELESLYSRDGFRETALRLINAEAQRVPRGRFAFARLGFHMFLRP